jgi:predicted O-linked N-acetylglucosamine transferase (SPINDLY family)
MNMHIDNCGAEDKKSANYTTNKDQVMDMAQAIKTAVSYHHAGNLIAAENLGRKILAIQPEHADALHLLGVVTHQKGSLAKAVDLIEKAMHFNPNEPSYYNSLANILTDQGKFDEAIACYQKVLQAAPGSVAILTNLGHSYEVKGELYKAIFYYRQALQLEPNFAQAHYTLGNALKRQGKLQDAIASYQNALQIDADFEEARNNMGNAYYELGDHNSAIACYQSVLQINPNYAEAYNNLANALTEQGKLEEAISCHEKSIEYNADNAIAYNNMGVTLKDLGRSDEALTYFQKALHIDPDLIEVHKNIGVTLQSLGKLDEALSCFQTLLHIRPDTGTEIKSALILPVICDSIQSIQLARENIDQHLNELIKKDLKITDPFKQIGTANFFLAYHGLSNKDLQKKIAAMHIQSCPELEWKPAQDRACKKKHSKIAVGIISKFLYAHTIGHLNHGIIQHLDRQKFHVTLFRFAGRTDELSAAIDQAADEVVVLPNRWEPARQAIAKKSTDILFYPDVGMDPLTYFLAFARLAPVQCTTWGHPDTTGIPNMDFYISSAVAEPPSAQEHYSEQLVLLNNFAMYCQRPRLPENGLCRKDMAFSDRHNLYASIQSLFKVHPDFDDIIAKILRRDPNAIVLFFEGKHAHWANLLRERFARSMPDVYHRIRFLQRLSAQAFLSFLRIPDVILDTPHFSGGYTSLLAFDSGAPIATWPGELMRGRLTYALYKQMGIRDCVADNSEAYVNIALRLAKDKAWNREIRSKIITRAHAFFENMEPVRELECFFEWAHTTDRKTFIRSHNENDKQRSTPRGRGFLELNKSWKTRPTSHTPGIRKTP